MTDRIQQVLDGIEGGVYRLGHIDGQNAQLDVDRATIEEILS